MATPLLDETLSSSTQTSAVEVFGRFNLELSGTWAGTVTVQRSRDAGATWVSAARDAEGNALSFTANTSGIRMEEDEQGIRYRVDFTRTSGSVRVRIGQGSVIIPGQRA